MRLRIGQLAISRSCSAAHRRFSGADQDGKRDGVRNRFGICHICVCLCVERDGKGRFARRKAESNRCHLIFLLSVPIPFPHIISPPPSHRPSSPLSVGPLSHRPLKHLSVKTGSKLQKIHGETSKFKGTFGEDDPTLRELYKKVILTSQP